MYRIYLRHRNYRQRIISYDGQYGMKKSQLNKQKQQYVTTLLTACRMRSDRQILDRAGRQSGRMLQLRREPVIPSSSGPSRQLSANRATVSGRRSLGDDAGTCSRISVTTGGSCVAWRPTGPTGPSVVALSARAAFLGPYCNSIYIWARSDISRIIRNINPQATALQCTCFGSVVCFQRELPACSSC